MPHGPLVLEKVELSRGVPLRAARRGGGRDRSQGSDNAVKHRLFVRACLGAHRAGNRPSRPPHLFAAFSVGLLTVNGLLVEVAAIEPLQRATQGR